MVRLLADLFCGVVRRYLPDAFLFAAILTVIVAIAGMVGEGQSPVAMIRYWGDGFWNLLSFAMQMVLILVTGHVLAKTPLVQGLLKRLATTVHSPSGAIILVTVVACLACWINWGFGLIVGALLARELAIQIRGIHYPLLVASAYSGFLVWHAGLSGSIPLKVAEPGDDALSQLTNGVAIPLSETIFSVGALTIVGVLIISLPLLNRLMMPRGGEVREADPHRLADSEPAAAGKAAQTPAERIENSALIPTGLTVMGLSYLVIYFIDGGSVGLNTVNFIFLFAGIALHGTPASYLNAVNDAIKNTGGIVLQFPLYAGIMGMMISSGLAASISQWFVSISTAQTFPVLTFLSAGLVNFFVPSGGGQWAVQAPVVMPAADALQVPHATAAMAVALGDAWTNMVQPFWALPLLGIAGLGIRDIMGYCTVALLWSGLVMGLGLYFIF